ncbi:MAG: TolB family protein [Anaerolineae bacterium]
MRRLTHGPGSSVDARFSPDGTKIVFASDRAGDWYIYTMNADGTNVRQLAPAGHWAAPDWSPDGTRIIYKCPPQGLCVMNADGTNSRRLTSTDDTFARWSHDGSRIVFQSTRNGAPRSM